MLQDLSPRPRPAPESVLFRERGVGTDENMKEVCHAAAAHGKHLLRPVDAAVVAHANVVLRVGVPVLGRLDPGGQRLSLLHLKRRVRRERALDWARGARGALAWDVGQGNALPRPPQRLGGGLVGADGALRPLQVGELPLARAPRRRLAWGRHAAAPTRVPLAATEGCQLGKKEKKIQATEKNI